MYLFRQYTISSSAFRNKSQFFLNNFDFVHSLQQHFEIWLNLVGRRVVEFINAHQSKPIPRKIMWSLSFTENPSYPQNIQFLGDKIRATRMENFMSTELLVKKIGINESTIVNWELKDIKPSSGLLKRIEVFFASHGSEPSGWTQTAGIKSGNLLSWQKRRWNKIVNYWEGRGTHMNTKSWLWE